MGRAVFKTVGGREGVPGRFDSCLFRHKAAMVSAYFGRLGNRDRGCRFPAHRHASTVALHAHRCRSRCRARPERQWLPFCVFRSPVNTHFAPADILDNPDEIDGLAEVKRFHRADHLLRLKLRRLMHHDPLRRSPGVEPRETLTQAARDCGSGLPRPLLEVLIFRSSRLVSLFCPQTARERVLRAIVNRNAPVLQRRARINKYEFRRYGH